VWVDIASWRRRLSPATLGGCLEHAQRRQADQWVASPLTGRAPFGVAVAAGHPIGGGSVGFLRRETAVGELLGFKQGQRIGTARVAEFESDLIRLRIKEGVKVAKAKGRLRGKQWFPTSRGIALGTEPVHMQCHIGLDA